MKVMCYLEGEGFGGGVIVEKWIFMGVRVKEKISIDHGCELLFKFIVSQA